MNSAWNVRAQLDMCSRPFPSARIYQPAYALLAQGCSSPGACLVFHQPQVERMHRPRMGTFPRTAEVFAGSLGMPPSCNRCMG